MEFNEYFKQDWRFRIKEMLRVCFFLAFPLILVHVVNGATTSPSKSPTLSPTTKYFEYAQDIIAGTGSPGSTGVGGPATSALFNYPRGIWVDSTGIAYVNGQFENCIRKFSTTGTNTLSLVAGQCGASSIHSGDNVPATSAKLGDPFGLFGDTMGGIYIGGYTVHRAQYVSSAGIISTYAGSGSGTVSGDGGAATSAGCPNVAGVWLNTVGVLFIALVNDGGIRNIDASGIINTFAGEFVVRFIVVYLIVMERELWSKLWW